MAEAIRVDGLKELQAKLRAVDRALPRQLRAANKEAAQVVADRAKVLVPVRSGRLKGSIGVRAGQRDAEVKAGSAARVPYAGPIHFGWPGRPNRDRGWRGGPIRPQPFLYQARDQRIGAVIAVYEQRIDKLTRSV